MWLGYLKCIRQPYPDLLNLTDSFHGLPKKSNLTLSFLKCFTDFKSRLQSAHKYGNKFGNLNTILIWNEWVWSLIKFL